MNPMTRQRFIALLAAGGAMCLGLPFSVFAEEKTRGPICSWARLRYPSPGREVDDWGAEPAGDLNLLRAIREQTSANVTEEWFVADVASLDSMIQFPFLFMHGNYAPMLSDSHRANLREYLLRGGFLFAEDCINDRSRGDDFFRRMAEVDFPKMFPETKLERLPFDHPVFHCFHNFKAGLPHMQGVPHGLHGLTINGRLLALLSPSDIHCGWANGDKWFGHGKQVQAFQMGINIYLYAMMQAGVVLAGRAAAASSPRKQTPEPPFRLLSK
jgi:hypothetical protein